MKRNFIIVICFIIIFFGSILHSQSYLGYYFIPTEYYYYKEISGGTISAATGDDGAESINLPFPFKYMGLTYTTARISTNGWLEMGQTFTGLGYSNELASNTQKPLICPLWDDLYDDNLSEIRYETIGAYPARMFIVQWKNIRWRDAPTFRKSFQVRLWEIDGTIDFSYGPGTDGSWGVSLSVGLNNHIGGNGNFISVSPNYQSPYPPSLSTTIANDTIQYPSAFRNGSLLTFVPNIYIFGNPSAVLYQTPDSLIKGAINQKVLAIIIPCHAGGVLTPPWVTDFHFNTNGTTNTNDLKRAKLYSTGSSPIFTSQTKLGSTVLNPNGQFTIGGLSSVYLNNNGLSYFWLTYDIDSNATVGNFVDGTCYKIERTGCCPPILPDTTLTSSKCTIKEFGLQGTLSIGISSQYSSITQALNSIKNLPLSGPVILELQNSYQSSLENFPITIPPLIGISENNTLTIRPATDALNINIVGSSTSIFDFKSSLFTTIDGRAGGTGIDQNLTIKNTSLKGRSINFSDGTQFNTIKYCNIISSDTTTDGGVIYFDKSYYSTNNNLEVSNSIISGDPIGNTKSCINFNNSNYYNYLITIFDCDIKNFSNIGINVPDKAEGVSIKKCSLFNEYEFPSINLVGISSQGWRTIVDQSRIYSLIPHTLSANSVKGLEILNSSSETLSNNFISLEGNQKSSLTGIEVWGNYASQFKMFHNTVLIAGTNSTNQNSFAFRRKWGQYNAGFTMDIKNNILSNIRVNITDTAKHFSISIEDDRRDIKLDYNNYFVAPGNNTLGQWKGINISNLNHWKAITQKDSHSVSKNAEFVSNIDLHLTGSSLGDTTLIGLPISTVLTDIDGENRHPVYPYMGADENIQFPLPIELVNFTANFQFPNVVLQWHTKTEKNNLGFEIEKKHSTNDWKKIGFVNGNGTTAENHNYSFTDEKVEAGKLAYRLKQIDYNGNVNYSEVIEVENSTPQEFQLHQNFPNPFNPTTKIQYDIPTDTKVQLKIYDILGREVKTLVNDHQAAGRYNIEFNASNLASGVYIYQISAKHFVKSRKMMVIK